jgi:hypothetical protein
MKIAKVMVSRIGGVVAAAEKRREEGGREEEEMTCHILPLFLCSSGFQ